MKRISINGVEFNAGDGGPVLRGAKRLMNRQRPIIFLEAHFSVLKEVSGGDTVTTFEGINGHRYCLWPK